MLGSLWGSMNLGIKFDPKSQEQFKLRQFWDDSPKAYDKITPGFLKKIQIINNQNNKPIAMMT